MIRSMTGYANKTCMLTIENQKVPLTVSIKSVNSRFFETNFRLPHALQSLEHDLFKRFKKELCRGRISCTIHLGSNAILKTSIEPALNVVQEYLKAINAIKKEFGVQGEASLDRLITLPSIFEVTEKELDEDAKKLIIECAQEVVKQLISQQEAEGAALKNDIQKRVERMTHEIAQIKALSAQHIEAEKEKIHQAINALPIEESQFELMQKNALFSYLDKIDIHEEIVRFESHLAQITTQLHSQEIEKGKRLDFTLQELGREINTIAAKCSDAQIGQKAIDIKVEVEKAREQTQNLV